MRWYSSIVEQSAGHGQNVSTATGGVFAGSTTAQQPATATASFAPGAYYGHERMDDMPAAPDHGVPATVPQKSARRSRRFFTWNMHQNQQTKADPGGTLSAGSTPNPCNHRTGSARHDPLARRGSCDLQLHHNRRCSNRNQLGQHEPTRRTSTDSPWAALGLGGGDGSTPTTSGSVASFHPYTPQIEELRHLDRQLQILHPAFFHADTHLTTEDACSPLSNPCVCREVSNRLCSNLRSTAGADRCWRCSRCKPSQ